jgi:hypothetical protein
LAALLLAAAPCGAAEPRHARAEEVAPLLRAMRDTLPAGLAGLDESRLATAWPAWVRDRDRAVRQRLRRGDQDTVVNLLYFGTSFTSAPRLTAEALSRLDQDGAVSLLARRIDDLVSALLKPGGDERLALARSALGVPSARRAGSPAAVRRAVERPLLEAVARAQKEQTAFAGELARIRAMPDATEQVAARATLFRERGISLDTSLRPAYAIDEALRDAVERGLLARGSVRRVAVVGPGLDFVEKAEGQDFYPPQSLQCLALADSLARLGLASLDALSIAAFDISPRVLDHLSRAGADARAGKGYVLQLPRPREGWGSALVGYWERFGDAVAAPAGALKPPASAGDVVVRAVRVRPQVVARVEPRDLNVVYQRLDLPEDERFDLVVATNVLVYYDTFEQVLALANVASMTAGGGLFLTNTAVLELPDSRLRSAGYRTVVYSDAPDDGEHVLMYRRLP